MGPGDRDRLTRLLGDPELAWVLARARRRLELGQPLHGTIFVRSATAAQRGAVARLFGRMPRAARGLSVSLDELDALVRRSGVHAEGLAGAVETLTGPVVIRAEHLARDARRWDAAFARIDAAATGCPALAAWLARVRARGLVKRLCGSPSDGRELLDALATVVEALPVAGGEPLSGFATRVAGRAHALDRDSPLGTLAEGAARALAGLAPPTADESPSEARRETWAAVGVLCDELSSTVLTVGLPGDGSATGRILAAAGREPVWLTLRQLVRCPPQWHGLDTVLVVENPSVLAVAADGGRCPPLVCTNGQPRAATMTLLRAMASAGVKLRHHGDFDWPGVTIGNVLHRRLPIVPFEFDRDAYTRAAAAHPRAAPLIGPPVRATWDEGLAAAMTTTARQVEEEAVARHVIDRFLALSEQQHVSCLRT